MNLATNPEKFYQTAERELTFNKISSLIHILQGVEEFMLSDEGYILGSNLEAANVTGYEEYEIIGKHISIFYCPDELGKAMADLERARSQKSIVTTGLRVKKRGISFWGRMRIQFIPSPNHEGPRFKVILQDATHKAISRLRIQNLREDYLAIFNNPFVGTFKFRINGFGIISCNQKTLEIFEQENATELKFDSFFSSLSEFDDFISKLKKDKKLEGYKFKTQGRNLKDRWIMVSAHYFKEQDYAEGVFFDVTDQHEQMNELLRVNTELDNFIYHASHDLRSPLTSILGLVNLGLNEPSEEMVKTYLAKIKSRVDHLDSLLKGLISVSYNNEVDVEFTPFIFEREINSIVHSHISEKIPVKINIEIIQSADFRTDPTRMRTILRNLISNSLLYYNPSIANPFMKLFVRVEATHCAIHLQDNGIGIKPELKNRVYDMFFRASERSTSHGLGLYIVKSMVDKLKGRISFESTQHIGTTFLITIPNGKTKSDRNNISSALIRDLMLNTKQIELVENSWDYILLNSYETGVVFYKKLFEIDPSLRQLFKGDIKIQSEKLVAMVTFAVHKLNNLDDIIADIKTLGIHHKQISVLPEHYSTVAEALLWTLQQALGEKWNKEVEEAWKSVYDALSRTMIEAAG